jgi:putative DNA primase/helicase
LENIEPWSEPVCALDLIDEIYTAILNHVAMDLSGALAVALWVLHAHAHDAAHVSPVLALTSPEKRCGKTTALLVIGALVPRPVQVGNITPAALFRAVEKLHPTLLIDEADTFLREREELRGVLNSGHLRGAAQVIRTVGDDYEPRLFSTWCPKAIALIGSLPATLADRALLIPMRRRAPGEKVRRLRLDRLQDELAETRRRAARWAQDTVDALRLADPEIPHQLNDRAADNWRPLLAIAELAGWVWPVKAREAALVLSTSAEDADGAPAIQLLADIRDLFELEGVDRLATKSLVEALGVREDRPWSEWKRGRPVTARQIARLLKPFGIHPRQFWTDGTKVRGYELPDFADAFSRYLTADPVEAVGHNESAT